MEKIKKLIVCSDIHIKTNKDHQRHKEVLDKFIEDCKNIVSEYDPEECRIMVLGDIIDAKLETSNDLFLIVTWFLKELSSMCKVIVIAGNHDYNVANPFSKKHLLEVIVDTVTLPNLVYLDKYLSFASGIYVDNNIAFCLYSIFENYRKPEIEMHKIKDNPNKDLKYIALLHGPIKGSSTDGTYQISAGFDVEEFTGCEIALCGDIHKRSVINYSGGFAIYPSSMIQVNLGENVSKHGYIVLDVETLDFEEMDIENESSYYKFKISSFSDVENGVEDFVNF
jgi:DNA repair exonuclease SbcCD nuclease subunit